MSKRFGWGLLALIVVGFCARNLPWHLDDLDQAKQAFTSFEMVEEGNWWFQHTPRGKIATKPPLAGWLSAGVYGVTRCWDLAWRLPSLIASIVLLWMLWRTGIRRDVACGIIAAGAFGLNLFVPRLASLVRTDALLTLFIFLAGWFIYEKLRTGSLWTTRDRACLCAVLLASALTKGPIAFAFLIPGLIAFHVIARSHEDQPKAWSGWWPWLVPLVAFGLWAGIGMAQSREFYEQVVLKEFLGRFTVGEEAVHNNLPPGTYTLGLLGRWAPWSLGFAALLFMREVRAAIVRRPELLWLACWAGGGLLFMECVPSKRFDRILPVLPPLCLLLAEMAGAWESRWRERAVCVAVACAIPLSGGYTIFAVVKAYRTDQRALVRFGEKVRKVSAERGWSYGITGTKDEGMLLYLRQARFLKDADEKWRRGEIDAVVVTEQALKKNREDFEPHTVILDSGKIENKGGRYLFIARH